MKFYAEYTAFAMTCLWLTRFIIFSAEIWNLSFIEGTMRVLSQLSPQIDFYTANWCTSEYFPTNWCYNVSSRDVELNEHKMLFSRASRSEWFGPACLIICFHGVILKCLHNIGQYVNKFRLIHNYSYWYLNKRMYDFFLLLKARHLIIMTSKFHKYNYQFTSLLLGFIIKAILRTIDLSNWRERLISNQRPYHHFQWDWNSWWLAY